MTSPASECVPVAFLSGGGLAVVTSFRNARGNRFGLSWWTREAR